MPVLRRHKPRFLMPFLLYKRDAGWAGGLTLDHRLALGVNALVQADANQVSARGIALSRRRVVRENLRDARSS